MRKEDDYTEIDDLPHRSVRMFISKGPKIISGISKMERWFQRQVIGLRIYLKPYEEISKHEKICRYCKEIYKEWVTHYLTECIKGFDIRNDLRYGASLRSRIPVGHENEIASILDDQHRRKYVDLIPLVKEFPPF